MKEDLRASIMMGSVTRSSEKAASKDAGWKCSEATP